MISMKKGLRVTTVENILEKLKDKYGYVSKKDFQLEIAILKEEKIDTSAPMPRINNRQGLIDDINKYRREIKKSPERSSLVKKKICYFNSLDDIQKQGITYNDIEFLAFRNGYWEKLITHFGEITPENFVYRASEVMEILKISKPTMARLDKICRFKVYVKCKVRIGAKQEIEYNSKDGWISFYSLNKLYAYLNNELSDYELNLSFY